MCLCRFCRCSDLLHSGWFKAGGGASWSSRQQQEVQPAHPAACRPGDSPSGGCHQVSGHLTSVRTGSRCFQCRSIKFMFVCSDGRESSIVTKVFSVDPLDDFLQVITHLPAADHISQLPLHTPDDSQKCFLCLPATA